MKKNKRNKPGKIPAGNNAAKQNSTSSLSHNRFADALEHHRSGRLEKAETIYKKILEQNPQESNALHMYGVLRCQQGDFTSGVGLIEQAIEANPLIPAFHCNLANALNETGNNEKALAACRKAVGLKKDYAEAYHIQGICLNALGRKTEAIESYRKALKYRPEMFGTWNNLGILLREASDLKGAIDCFGTAIECNPNYAEAHNNLGNAYKSAGKSSQAIACYTEAIRINPDYADAYTNMAGAFKDRGDIAEAIRLDRKALELNPAHATCHSNLLLTMHYLEYLDPEDLFEEHKKWAKMHASSLAQDVKPHTNDCTLSRRIRVGYVSPDFKTHSVAYFIEAILAYHNREDFEVFCYSDVAGTDDTTERLCALTDIWRDISEKDESSIARIIREDRIDILVDLAGHTGRKNMGIFARRPAPIQVTYLGYPDTTGLPTMDYRIVDAFTDPPGSKDRLNTEELVRLPGSFLCYTPPEDTSQEGNLPALINGYVTFGSFNNRAKITPEVIRTWAGILHALPDARLIIKCTSLSDPENEKTLLELFDKNSIPAARLTLYGYMPSRSDHFALYNSIDIALDTFPYNGTTTTCEAMWMGVPTIVMEGASHVSRVGTSILSNTGLADLIATSREDYIQKAVGLAGDTGRLRYLRSNMRSTMTSSPLMDAKGFILELEASYTDMWRKWCEKYSDDAFCLPGEASEAKQKDLCSRCMELIRTGEGLFSSGDIQGARKAFIEALHIDPECPDALNNLGVLYWQTGEPARAVECFNKALQIDPGNEDTLHNLREIQGEQNKSASQDTQNSFDESCLQICIENNIRVCVPRSLQKMTCYVLLEQEDWFEEEICFIRRLLQPGMKVIDIGANFGLYTLTASKIVGGSGRVWAFEPASSTAGFLEKSISINRSTNVELVQAGLSDRDGTAIMELNSDPELNAITSDDEKDLGEHETIRITSMDTCKASYGWNDIDFIKLDAEGQEHNIIAGGKDFFFTQSPLIMYELKHNDAVNMELINDFLSIGYRSYRLVPGLGILIPFKLNDFDKFHLNLFCCKDDRAKALERQGLLITRISSSPHIEDTSIWRRELQSLSFARKLMAGWRSFGSTDAVKGWKNYENALNYYFLSHTGPESACLRHASLMEAKRELDNALKSETTIPRLLTRSRVLCELGYRSASLETVNIILNMISTNRTIELFEPFIPISQRYENMDAEDIVKWLTASILEQKEKIHSYSTFFTGKVSLSTLEMIKSTGYQTPEMERRRQLVRMSLGIQDGPVPSEILQKETPDNKNPDLWKNSCIFRS